jgi:hypothetical protein
MKTVRRLTVVLAFFTWIFTFTLLHDAQDFFKVGTTGGIPTWLVALLGLALIASVGTVATGAIRLPLWPWLAIATAVLVVLGTLGAHAAALQARYHQVVRAGLRPRPVGLGAALGEASSGAVHLFFFIIAPVLLIAAGIFGWYYGPRTMFAPEPPHAA